jgi:3-oxoacyl-[acyl-carrier-protein] synthase II
MSKLPKSDSRRVVVTAIGVVSPLGCGLAENVAALRAGRDCVQAVTAFDVSKTRSKLAGQVDGFQISDFRFQFSDFRWKRDCIRQAK